MGDWAPPVPEEIRTRILRHLFFINGDSVYPGDASKPDFVDHENRASVINGRARFEACSTVVAFC
jgi:hypothetical protein